MNKNNLILIKKLISIKSTDKNPNGLESALKLVLKELGGFKVEKFKKNGTSSALVYNTKKRPGKFKVLFNIHLDVIPAKDSQFKPKVVGRKLFGAGSMDMKSNAVCIIEVFKKMANNVKYPIGIQITTDEESGGQNGTKYQVEKGVLADFIITSEPTNFDIIYKATGVLQIEIKSIGKTAHGAYPWKGRNAIEDMNRFLFELSKIFKNPVKDSWRTTLNISKIKTSNNAFNKIPDDCLVWLDIRFIEKHPKVILRKIKKILPKNFSLKIINEAMPINTNKNDKNIIILKKILDDTLSKKANLRGANGTSDLCHYSKFNCPGIEFGPIGGGIGSDKEWVDIPSLETYSGVITKFLDRLDK